MKFRNGRLSVSSELINLSLEALDQIKACWMRLPAERLRAGLSRPGYGKVAAVDRKG